MLCAGAFSLTSMPLSFVLSSDRFFVGLTFSATVSFIGLVVSAVGMMMDGISSYYYTKVESYVQGSKFKVSVCLCPFIVLL
jgi:hypothetical protein